MWESGPWQPPPLLLVPGHIFEYALRSLALAQSLLHLGSVPVWEKLARFCACRAQFRKVLTWGS